MKRYVQVHFVVSNGRIVIRGIERVEKLSVISIKVVIQIQIHEIWSFYSQENL